MAVDRIVIVGAGQGGFQAAASLRQEKFEGDIVLIGAEAGLPYQRPPLSKAYLKSGEEGELRLRPESFYEKNGITYRSGLTVDAIDRAAGKVTAGGESIAYDHLILATGTENLRPPIPGLDRALDLRTRADADRLREALENVERVAVIGGGFIGLEFAAVARGFGREVAVAEAADRLMARVVSPEMSTRFRDKHLELGTTLHMCQPVTAVTEAGLELADGTGIAADLILLAAGVRPVTALAEAAGLAVENGVVVDAMLLTEDPAISALGDCAAFPDLRTGRLVRLESVQAATDHARAIAKRLVQGATEPYDAVPWFWSDQSDWKLQIAGLASPGDESVTAHSGAVFRHDGETITAVETVNEPRPHMLTRRLMAAGKMPGVAALEAADFDLSAV